MNDNRPATVISAEGNPEHEEIRRLATIINRAIPQNADGGFVLGALIMVLRGGFDSLIEDPHERLRVYDELVNGNRSLMAKDAGIASN